MPHTKFQKLFFMSLTVLLSVILFVIYNVAISMGTISQKVFFIAIKEIPIEFCIAFLLESLFAYKLSQKIAFKIVNPAKNKPVVIILAITCATICIMCPSMSFAATILYNGFDSAFLLHWFKKISYNLPFAFITQIFFIGPLVRLIFKNVFKNTGINVSV